MLQQRMYGYSLSEIEKELIFRRENTGFVRPLNRAGTVFYLDPSPFLPTQKREVYVSLSAPPSEKTLIRVTVSDIKEEVMKDRGGYYTLSIKLISSWEKIDPNTLVSRKPLISPDEVKDYFTLPYTGEEEIVDEVALCSALYAVSSPALHDVKGGIRAAVFGKKKAWTGFRRGMEIIPLELKKPSSDYFYRIANEDKGIADLAGKEINLAYLNPGPTPMDIPMVLEVGQRSLSSYKEAMDSQKPLVTAFMLDALMIQPEVPDTLERFMADTLYELVSDVKGAGSIPYMQDFSSFIPRLGASFSRYHSRFEVRKEDIQKSVEMWSDMFYRAKKTVSTEHPVSRLYRLSDNARKLYIDLYDLFGIDIPISITDVMKEICIFRNEWDYDEALDDLNRQGLIIRLNHERIKLLDFGKKCSA